MRECNKIKGFSVNESWPECISGSRKVSTVGPWLRQRKEGERTLPCGLYKRSEKTLGSWPQPRCAMEIGGKGAGGGGGIQQNSVLDTEVLVGLEEGDSW